MKFRTEYTAGKAGFSLSPDYPVVMMGSCFAGNISSRMRDCLWNVVNPGGTLYNPFSIERVIRLLLFSEHADAVFSDSLFQSSGKFHSWLFDSRLSAENVEDCHAEFVERGGLLDSILRKAKAMFVTFGTAWCYFLSDREDYVVANCHKQPSSMFRRRRLTVDEIVETWVRMAEMLKESYPQLEIVFTVSPVRHLKDGFAGNSHSKAILLLATEEICSRLEYCHYFPAYEIVTDDLRDYRFYASDLVHPSEEAVEYIWEKFRETYLDESGEAVLREGEKLLKAWRHRPLPDSTSTPSRDKIEREERRLEEIRLRHDAFRSLHPDML